MKRLLLCGLLAACIAPSEVEAANSRILALPVSLGQQVYSVEVVGVKRPNSVGMLEFQLCDSRLAMLEWCRPDKVSFFKVYRKEPGKKYKLLGKTEDTVFFDETFCANRMYQYKVIAVRVREDGAKLSSDPEYCVYEGGLKQGASTTITTDKIEGTARPVSAGY